MVAVYNIAIIFTVPQIGCIPCVSVDPGYIPADCGLFAGCYVTEALSYLQYGIRRNNAPLPSAWEGQCLDVALREEVCARHGPRPSPQGHPSRSPSISTIQP